MRDLKIAVLGAGVIGTNTVLHLQQRFPSADITLIDDKFNEETLSYGPAGIFRPGSQFGGLPTDIVRQFVDYSFHFYKDLIPVANSGVTDVCGYIFSDVSQSNVKNHFLQSLLPVYRDADPDELLRFDGKTWNYGSYFETLLTQCSSFIPWALIRIQEHKATLLKQKINDFIELQNDYNVVFNCTGLESKRLCDDRHMVPIRGQLIKVSAPWLKKFYYNDTDTFVIPLGEGFATMGTCKQYEGCNPNIDKHDSASIIERCTTLVPEMATARIVSIWVGFRPHRHILRLEIENRANLKIVHNYGHGGYGITTAPGTAHQAVEKFRLSHLSNSKL